MRHSYDYCPRCMSLIPRGSGRGSSSIYQSHDIPDLCEPCFFDEEAEIDERGTNNLPDTLGRYRQNMQRLRAEGATR